MKMAHNNERSKAAMPSQTTETGKVSLNDEIKCTQCGSQYNNTNFRKVTDDCGHSKCRRCLAESENMCILCKTQQEKNPSSISSLEPTKEIHRTHTGELPFRCTICERRFLRHQNLKRHYRTVHKQSENETKLVSSKAGPQLKISTASKSSPIIARNVQSNVRTRSEHKKMLKEKVKNLRQCEKGSSNFSLEKALSENVDDEKGNEMVIHEEQESFELPNRDSNPTLVLVTADMHNTADKEMGNKTNNVHNIVEVEPPGFQKEREKEREQQPSFPDLLSSCPILIDDDELLEANDQMQVDNATQIHDITTPSEVAHGTQIFTLEVQGQDENKGEFENTLSISENENGEETSGGINLLHQSTSSPPSAEIQADIQGNRGPRKYYISRYYIVHQTDSTTSS